MNTESLENPHLAGEVDGLAEATPKEKKARSPKTAAKQGSTKHCVEVTLAVAATKGPTLSILAAASGVSNESVHDIALGVLTNFARTKEVIATSLEIASADPMESGILATMCSNEDPALFKSVWGLAGALNPSLPATAPAAKGKSGLELARSLQALSLDDRTALRKASAVLA